VGGDAAEELIMHPHSAAALGLYACHTCGLVSRPLAADEVAHCPRCGAALHQRKPDSIGRTWAMLITAYILIIPANVLPIMQTGSLFGSQRDTILSGVLYLWSSGSWALALLVFFASVIVPIAKLVALTYLLFSVQRRSPRHPRRRTKLYHLLKFIGRWSMLDIYVVTLLVALVQLQSLATIQAAPGAVAFGAVVVITMFASMTFDPRMIWDSTKEKNG
jgi:paraquat-inducible protein A